MSKTHDTPAPKPDALDTCLTTATAAAKDLLGDNNTTADAPPSPCPPQSTRMVRFPRPSSRLRSPSPSSSKSPSPKSPPSRAADGTGKQTVCNHKSNTVFFSSPYRAPHEVPQCSPSSCHLPPARFFWATVFSGGAGFALMFSGIRVGSPTTVVSGAFLGMYIALLGSILWMHLCAYSGQIYKSEWLFMVIALAPVPFWFTTLFFLPHLCDNSAPLLALPCITLFVAMSLPDKKTSAVLIERVAVWNKRVIRRISKYTASLAWVLTFLRNFAVNNHI